MKKNSHHSDSTLELLRKARTVHGKRYSKTYRTWTSMIARCHNANVHSYPRYGGRGIRVCEEWLMFECFYNDVGDHPDGTSLDRINNDGNYEPGNCRWATSAQQHNNTSRSRFIRVAGEKMTVKQAALKFNVEPSTIAHRLNRGCSAEEAVSPTRLVSACRT